MKQALGRATLLISRVCGNIESAAILSWDLAGKFHSRKALTNLLLGLARAIAGPVPKPGTRTPILWVGLEP